MQRQRDGRNLSTTSVKSLRFSIQTHRKGVAEFSPSLLPIILVYQYRSITATDSCVASGTGIFATRWPVIFVSMTQIVLHPHRTAGRVENTMTEVLRALAIRLQTKDAPEVFNAQYSGGPMIKRFRITEL